MNNKQEFFQNPFDGLITSKTRVRILLRLYLNPQQRVYVRGFANEFGLSTSIVKAELSQMVAAGFLRCERQGRRIWYWANVQHKLYPELHSMVKKSLGLAGS